MANSAPYKFKLKNVRLSFAHLRKPYEEGGKLSCRLLLPEGDPQIDMVKKKIKAICDEKNDGKKPSPDRLCLRDGEHVDKEGYEGHWYISASNDYIQILDRRANEITDPRHPQEPYSGCYVNAVLELWFQNNQNYGKRVNCNVLGVQFAKDGDAFGRGKQDVSDEFDAIDDDDYESYAGSSDDSGDDDWYK